MKAHLLILDQSPVGREIVRDEIDRLDTVEDRTLFFGNAMFFVSSKSARSLSKDVREVLSPNARDVLNTFDREQKAGWLPSWQMINDAVPEELDSDA